MEPIKFIFWVIISVVQLSWIMFKNFFFNPRSLGYFKYRKTRKEISLLEKLMFKYGCPIEIVNVELLGSCLVLTGKIIKEEVKLPSRISGLLEKKLRFAPGSVFVNPVPDTNQVRIVINQYSYY
jgi:hypothetical protein